MCLQKDWSFFRSIYCSSFYSICMPAAQCILATIYCYLDFQTLEMVKTAKWDAILNRQIRESAHIT